MTKTEGQILIIDDDPGICTTLSDILEDAGYKVKSFEEGRKALDFLRKNPFDVVFVDLKLPDMNGMELLEQIKLIHPESAVVMITGHASTATAVEALNEGAYAYVVKPFDLDELKTIVKKAIKEIRLSLENKKLIDQLQRTNRELERYKKSLEAAVEKAELMRQQAAEATEAKGKFLANMSHEIRTPMNAIMGFGDLLSEEKLTDEQSHYVNIICNSGKHLLQVIDDILDFSKIEADKMDIEMGECSFRDLLAIIETMLHPLAAEKDLKFEIREDIGLPANIRTDSSRLQQCLINLVNNAIKFTEKGHVYVNVSLEDRDNQPYIRFDVEDTGIGISPDRQEKIFESFTQADEGTSRKYGGTGLGLAITKQLVKLLGGKLTLTSEQGKGSVFSIAIPAGLDVTRQSRLDIHTTHIDPIQAEAEQPEFSGYILVAEDVETNQILVKSLLKRMGLEVTIAQDGNEALQKALVRKFDLILMDIQMPNMNGYEATRALRKEGVKTPIVALTANTMKGDNKKCIEAGCDDYLAKPIDRRELLKIISKYLSSKSEDLSKKIDPCKAQVDELNQLCSDKKSLDKQNNEEVINWSEIVSRGMDEKILKEVVPIFLADKKERLNKLTQAIEAGDAKEVKLYAHAINGGAGNVGAKKLSQAAFELERMASQGDLSNAEELLEQIKIEFQRFESFVSKADWVEIAKQEADNKKQKHLCSSINP